MSEQPGPAWVDDEAYEAAQAVLQVLRGANADEAAASYRLAAETRGTPPNRAMAAVLRHVVTIAGIAARGGDPITLEAFADRYAEATDLSRLDTDMENPDE
jgi:hypothetical protein